MRRISKSSAQFYFLFSFFCFFFVLGSFSLVFSLDFRKEKLRNLRNLRGYLKYSESPLNFKLFDIKVSPDLSNLFDLGVNLFLVNLGKFLEKVTFLWNFQKILFFLKFLEKLFNLQNFWKSNFTEIFKKILLNFIRISSYSQRNFNEISTNFQPNFLRDSHT